MKRLIRGMARTNSGLTLLSGMAAVLLGLERLLSARVVYSSSKAPDRKSKGTTAELVSPVSWGACQPPKEPRQHYFKISQTRSELGYVYWVVQGFGCYQSFALFDTWAEAVADVTRSLEGAKVRAGFEETSLA